MVVVLVWLVVLLWQANALESFFFLKEGTVLNSLNTVAQYESEYDEGKPGHKVSTYHTHRLVLVEINILSLDQAV